MEAFKDIETELKVNGARKPRSEKQRKERIDDLIKLIRKRDKTGTFNMKFALSKNPKHVRMHCRMGLCPHLRWRGRGARKTQPEG